MRILERILIATDFSPNAERACRVGADLARRYEARVRVLSVIELPHVYQRIVNPVQTSLVSIDDLEQRAAAHMQELAGGPIFSGLGVDTEVRTGSPFLEIISAAEGGSCELIVVGTKSTHGAARLLLGSTAEKVVRKAPLPVLVAKTELPAEPSVIIVPIDFSPNTKRAAEEAVALARRWKARVEFVHVIEPITQTYVWPAEPAAIPMFPVEPADLDGEWDHFLSDLDLDGIGTSKLTLKGRAPETIVETAAAKRADLIIIGTHGYGGLMHILLGSVAEHVVREAPCCVLTIRPEAFQFALP